MIFIHTLRMISDLSVYYFFADLFVVSTGHPSQLFYMLFLSFCYGMLVYLQKKNFCKLYILLPLLVLILPGRNLLALLPPIAYILYLALKGQLNLSWERQSELFFLSIKLFLVGGVFLCLSGNYSNFVQYALPMVFLSLSASVLLMRMLRHDSSTYLDSQYQRKNCLIFLAVLLLAWLLSRDFVFTLLGNTIQTFYMKGIYPLLNLLIACFVSLLRILIKLFSWITLGKITLEENKLPDGEMGPTYADFSTSLETHVSDVKAILTMLAIIALLTAAFFFFRWLALHKGEDSLIGQGLDMIHEPDYVTTKKERAATTVLQVRKQYRIFLKRYSEYGGRLEISTTSEDVLAHSAKVLPNDQGVLNEMRAIYLQARYRGTATKADLRRMKQINKELSSH